MPESILITGGAGYIGSIISWTLNKAGFKVVILDRKIGNSVFQPWAEFVQADLLDSARMRECFQNHSFSAVIHCAALTSVCQSMADPGLYYSNNFHATIELLKLMIEFGVKKIVFSSSAAVYGLGSGRPIKETHSCQPISPYGKSKFFVECALEDFSCFDLKYAILRYFNVAGALFDGNLKLGEIHCPETHLIPLVIDKILKNEQIDIFGLSLKTPDGSAVRDFVHFADVAEANLMALRFLDAGKASEIFNVCSGFGSSVLEIIACAEQILGRKAIIRGLGSRAGEPAILVGDSARAKELLGLKFQASTIEKMVSSAILFRENCF